MSFSPGGRHSPQMSEARTQSEPSAAVAAARAGDEAAFAALVEPYRRELQVHCYRMLGSFEDSEDLVQETFLRAWRNRASFQGRSTFRAWLYRIATNACLDALERRPRTVPASGNAADIAWLQPFPDQLLDEAAPTEEQPESAVVSRETIELAFLVAIQHLPPRQRAVLIARDVLDWSARETAALLETSVASVNSALQRARATVKEQLPQGRLEWAAGTDPSEEERELLGRYMDATDRGDPDAIVQLLREDAFCAMPPAPESWVGRDKIVQAWVEGGFGQDWFGDMRSVPTRVNRQPAVAVYHRKPDETTFRPLALDVLRLEEGRVAEIIVFSLDRPLVEALDLPASL
jgi:RNA polymerase sigma-70 factor, ECF subfamily